MLQTTHSCLGRFYQQRRRRLLCGDWDTVGTRQICGAYGRARKGSGRSVRRCVRILPSWTVPAGSVVQCQWRHLIIGMWVACYLDPCASPSRKLRGALKGVLCRGGIVGEPRREIDDWDKSASLRGTASPRRSTRSIDAASARFSVSSVRQRSTAEGSLGILTQLCLRPCNEIWGPER